MVGCIAVLLAITVQNIHRFVEGSTVDSAAKASTFGGGILDVAFRGHYVGHDLAEVVGVAFIDFRCGFSRELYLILEEMRSRYPDHFAVSWYPLVHSGEAWRGHPAALATCAARQGAFDFFLREAMTDPVFPERDLGFIAERIKRVVGPSFNTMRWRECVRQGETLEELQNLVDSLPADWRGVSPILWIGDGVFRGAPSEAQLDSVVGSMLRRRPG